MLVLRHRVIFIAAEAIATLAFCACKSAPPPPPAAPVALTSAAIQSPEPSFGDAEIATVAQSIDSGISERARMAQGRTGDGRVAHFALDLLLDAPSQGIAQMKFPARPSSLGELVTSETGVASLWMTWTNGAHLDRTFIKSEQQAIGEGLRLIDDALLPRASGPQLKSELRRMRGRLETDLRQADYLSALLGDVD